MVSWDDNLRLWRISGDQPRVVLCPLCDDPMVPGSDSEGKRWVCMSISSHQEAVNADRMPGLRFVLV